MKWLSIGIINKWMGDNINFLIIESANSWQNDFLNGWRSESTSE